MKAGARAEALAIFGLCHTEPEDGLGDGTIVLLGPSEPGFWSHVQGEPEFKDGEADPMDRWSARVITDLAAATGARALFPFGNPARPFISWALRSESAWVSPVNLLVHAEAGLMVSYRGALLLPERIDLPSPGPGPCETCVGKPCLTACPVTALTEKGYDLAACHSFLDQPDGKDCISAGCAVRRACPVSQTYKRDPHQSAFHMAAFHPGISRS